MTTAIETPVATLPQRAALALKSTEQESALRALVLSSADIVAVTNKDGREQAPAEQAAVEAEGAANFARAHTPPSLRLGKITERLGFTVTADFMLTLGFAPAATDKASKLFHESDFKAICAAILRHVSAVQAKF